MEGNELKSIFGTRYSDYKYLVIHIGILNRYAIFQNMMNNILWNLID
jgi:hypothetical protein